MQITLNGENKEIKENISVSQLLIEEEVQSPEMVSVELNEEILPRDKFETTLLKEGDEVEFLYFMGGGIN